MLFALAFGSMIGTFTVLVLWIPLPFLHWTGIEEFEWPVGEVAWLLAISTLSNASTSPPLARTRRKRTDRSQRSRAHFWC